ncbi:MAG: glycosyltransferase family 4 protein, partial [Hyphomicrobiaceae bacterium]|nr:glycosyltransferase family 4 protein [Hyphomicrobiaceae bacterium]
IIPDLDTGGAEKSAVEIAAAVVKAGGRALVASRGGRLEKTLAEAGGELVRFPAATKNPLGIWRNSARLAEIIRTENVALIHARSRAPAWSALIAARRTGIPFVTTYHGAYNEKGPVKRLYNSVMARSDVVIANSRYTADLIRSRYGTPEDRVRVIYRGVDAALDPTAVSPERRAAVRQRWGIPPEVRVILQAARLTGWKGQTVLIDAVAQLAAREGWPDDTRVVLAGDAQGRDDYRAGLVARIEAAGLGHRVCLVGHEDDIAAAFAEAFVSIVASTEPEAFGRAGAESQAMGCPVIATRLGAPQETVLASPDVAPETATGWLVPAGDAVALATCLGEALAMSDTERAEIGGRGRAHVLANYTLAEMQRRTLSVYDELLGDGMLSAFDSAIGAANRVVRA